MYPHYLLSSSPTIHMSYFVHDMLKEASQKGRAHIVVASMLSSISFSQKPHEAAVWCIRESFTQRAFFAEGVSLSLSYSSHCRPDQKMFSSILIEKSETDRIRKERKEERLLGN